MAKKNDSEEYNNTDTVKSIDKALTVPELEKISKRANKKAKELLKEKTTESGDEDIL